MTILVTNDDGYQAKGVAALMRFLKPYGDVVAVCPDGPRSAQSMALTFIHPLRIFEVASPVEGTRMYKTTGTPVDCVKLARHVLFHDKLPDLVVSGINHGSNSAINVIYSGTMGASFEGCALGVPSIGFSLTSHNPDADFEGCRKFVDMLVPELLKHGLPEGVCLNVNIPDVSPYPTELRLTRQAKGGWTEEYREYTDPQGLPFYMVTGEFHNEEPDARDTDEWCLAHGIASVTPQLLDRTAPVAPEWLKQYK